MATSDDSVASGAPCWADLWTSDVEASRHFYSELFGWTAEEPSAEFGGYFTFTLPGGIPIAGGMGDMGEMRADNSWKPYLATPDAEKAARSAGDAGGTVVAPPMAVADLGIQAVVLDPTGAVVGLWEPRSFAGFAMTGEPGTPSWFELHTREPEKALSFYQSVFGLEPDRAEGGGYTTLRDASGTDRAGVMDASSTLPATLAARWAIFWVTEDIDSSLAKVKELGGSPAEPTESPYGRVAAATDPTGTSFNLHSPRSSRS